MVSLYLIYSEERHQQAFMEAFGGAETVQSKDVQRQIPMRGGAFTSSK